MINLLKSKSPLINTLEKEFGVNDSTTTIITEKIFNLASKNKMVKGINKRSILCASLYYAYYYLEKPKNFDVLLTKFKITRKNGSKGLKLCQIALQESPTTTTECEDIKKFKGQIHSFTSTHKVNLQELITKYNIPLKNYDEIEKIIITGHCKKNKILNDRVNGLWISCIYFWLSKINPYIDLEEFVSINSDYTTLSQLKSDLCYLRKNLI
jgi:transcription initiation factor TFIIIB Brf1 subunit/transcription initiation factor TFIIB